MKTFLTAAVALSLLAGTAASAQPYGHDDHHDQGRGPPMAQSMDRHDDRNDDRHDNGRHMGHRWSRGERLPTNYYRTRDHYVDYRAHHLRAPPRGYRWVQVDDNYVLVALTTGLIASIIANN